MSDVNAPIEILSLQAAQAKALQISNVRFEGEGLDISDYNITLMADENVWVIYYQPTDYPLDQRGSVGKKGYTVEIDKVSNRIVKAYYAR